MRLAPRPFRAATALHTHRRLLMFRTMTLRLATSSARFALRPKRTRRRGVKLLAACASLSLATAWAAPAEAATVHLSVTPTVALTTAYAVYFNKNSSGVFVRAL